MNEKRFDGCRINGLRVTEMDDALLVHPLVDLGGINARGDGQRRQEPAQCHDCFFHNDTPTLTVVCCTIIDSESQLLLRGH
jgi:hypothetical protein